MSAIVPQAINAALKAHPRCDSWTLRLDKFSFPENATGSWKKQALDDAVREFKPLPDSVQWLDSFKTQLGDRYRELRMVNTSRLAVALGRASVLENIGLAANRITGLPLIAGSAAKGLVSTWACWEANQLPDGSVGDGETFVRFRRRFSADLAKRVLGENPADARKEETEKPDKAGDIIFLGAFPVVNDKLKLEVDVLTPHSSGEPKPSFFLTVAPGTTWRFVLLASRRAGENFKPLLDTAADWLRQALIQIGIGAKTAAGYGRFAPADATSSSPAGERGQAAATGTPSPQAVAQSSDYNDAVFKNAALKTAESKGSWAQLQKEIPKLLKSENAQWLQKFKAATQGKEFKELRQQPWYPK